MQFDQSATARVHHLAWRSGVRLVLPAQRQRPMMAQNYLTFGDIDGKLDVLRAERTRCPRRGRYSARHKLRIIALKDQIADEDGTWIG